MCCLTCAKLHFLNIFSADDVAILCSVGLSRCLLNFTTETIQTTEGCPLASPAVKECANCYTQSPLRLTPTTHG